MKTLTAKTAALSILLLITFSILSPVLITYAASAASSLRIIGALVNDIVEPGKSYSYTTTIESAAGAPAMDIVVEARGFRNDLDGAWEYLEPGEDTSPYSALGFVSNISPASFHLEPGGSQDVTWNVDIPTDVGDGGRYAMLHIHTQPIGNGSVGYVLAAEIPLILTVSASEISMTGEITSLTVGNVSSGEPIEVSTVLRNTGNYHYKARNEVKVTDEYGGLVATAYTLLSDVEIIPTYSRALRGSLALLDQENGLPPGTYYLESKAMLFDGTVLDTETINVTVEETYKYPSGDTDTTDPYSVCAGLVQPSGSVRVFTNEIPSCIDSSSTAALKVCFSNTGAVTGRVITGKYASVPPVPVFYYAPESEGGTGKMPVKFVSVCVNGFSAGNVQISVFYNNDEVRDFEEESLILAYWDGVKWRSLNPVNIDPSSNTITGSIPVAELAKGCTPIGLGGAPAGEAAGEGGSPLWLFYLIPGVGISGIIAYIFWRRNRASVRPRGKRNINQKDQW